MIKRYPINGKFILKILITGATGLIGGRLVKSLELDKFYIKKVSRKKRKNFKIINWQSTKNLENLCKNINIVINCAGYDVHSAQKKKQTNKINAEFPYKLYQAANKNGVELFIFISTYHVYDFEKLKLINEKSRTKKKNIYTSSKILGEEKIILFKNKKTKVIIIRPCNLFGYPVYKNKNCWRLIVNSMVKDLLIEKKYTINSEYNSYRYYSSIRNFCLFITNLIQKYRNIKFEKKILIINYISNKNLNLVNLTNIIKKQIKEKKKQIIFKYKKLKKTKSINFKSNFSNKLYSSRDKHFNSEIKKIILYVKKNFNYQ